MTGITIILVRQNKNFQTIPAISLSLSLHIRFITKCCIFASSLRIKSVHFFFISITISSSPCHHPLFELLDDQPPNTMQVVHVQALGQASR